MKKYYFMFLILFILWSLPSSVSSQTTNTLSFGKGRGEAYSPFGGGGASWSVRMADAVITWHKDSITVKEGKPASWDYEQGLVLEALKRVWIRSGEGKYYYYIQKDLDRYVQTDGTIRTYDLEEYNIDNITPGRALLLLYQEAKKDKDKYKQAAFLLKKQLESHPRTQAKGFWHKKRYPNQMWLDGLYMAQPFYAEFSRTFKQNENFEDIILQFELIEKNLIDTKTGLLYHGYDESKQQKWANLQTGCSPNFWGRAMGWYMMALVDVLDNFPENHPKKASLIQYLNRLSKSLVKYQDKNSGCWYQIVDKANEKGNYLEASASCMYVYALAKGVRMNYLDKSYLPLAQKGYQGILKNFIEIDEKGTPHLNKTVSVGGLGGNPYRDGSYEYYLSEPIRKNDLKGVAPFILASIEMEIAEEQKVGKGKKIVLDYYFNNEYRKNLQGEMERFHYTWEDKTDSGFWLWGNVLKDYGAKISSLENAPTAQNLKEANIYIIVDPDTPKETANPNYIQAEHIKVLQEWVKTGGTLVLMANDTSRVELKHFNELTKVFGIQFNMKDRNMVQNNQFEQGKVLVPENHLFLKTTKTLYLKEICTLSLEKPAKANLTDKGDVLIATTQYGKGLVFVVVDPWFYNEYVNGKKLPAEFDNFKAMKELSVWLLSKAPLPPKGE